jgi:hypothetical protein
MSNMVTLLDQISSQQAAKEVVVNMLFDAASPAMLWGRHGSACNGLTWGYYGGSFQVGSTSNAIANGTVTLTASATNYVYASATTGAVSVNTTGFPAGAIPLYQIVTGALTATSYTDLRSYQPSAIGGSGAVTSVGLALPSDWTVTGSPVTGSGTLTGAYAAQPANYIHAGPTSGGAAAPTWRALVGADLPLFGPSGTNHAQGAVPDPGSTAGSTRYLCENGTWATPAGGSGGGGTVTDVAAMGGIETASGADITTNGTLRANLIPAIYTAAHTVVTGDRGTAIVMNSASAVSQALPGATGTTGSFPKGWFADFANIGAGVMTLTVPSGASLDGVTNGTLALSQYAGAMAFTDGANWFTLRGASAASGGSGTPDTPPQLSAFSWANQAGASASQQRWGISALFPKNPSGNSLLVQALPAAPSYQIVARLRLQPIDTNNSSGGLALYDSASGKFKGFIINYTNGIYYYVTNNNSPTSYNASPFSVAMGIPSEWFRIRSDGTNWYYEVSADGVSWVTLYQEAVNSFLTPNQCGLMGVGSTSFALSMGIMSWYAGT